MERLIECSEDYNPYKVIDKFSNVLINDYAFVVSITKDILDNVYIHDFDSGYLRIKISNNSIHDTYFHIEIDHAEHMGHMYKRVNLELLNDTDVYNLIEIFKNVIHQYKDDLSVESYRAVMIASIVD